MAGHDSLFTVPGVEAGCGPLPDRGFIGPLNNGGLGFPDGRLLSDAQLFQHTASWLRLHHLVMWYRYQPAARYTAFQLIEFGWLLVLSAALIAATVILIRRRAA